ncbi:hypothetical protein Tco_0638459, partial [Tanacetum coccineum]
MKTPKSLCNLTSLQSKGWSLRCYKHLKERLPLPPQSVLLYQQLYSLKSMNLLGENLEKQVVMWQKPPSYTKGEPMQIVTITKKLEDEAAETPMEQEPERPTRAIPISTVKQITRPNPEVALIESASRPPLTDPILEIHVPQQTAPKLVPASREFRQDLDEPIRVPYDIHGKIYQLKNYEIQSYLDKKEEIKKKAEEARLLEMTNFELIQ